MENKTLAIVSYITLIGWIIALVMNKEKDSLVSFHLRQYLLIMILGVVLSVVGAFVAFVPFLPLVLNLCVLVLWILGLISAVKGEEKAVPIVGGFAQSWFKFL